LSASADENLRTPRARPPAARVKVLLGTYRRNDLLPRAVESLRAQTLTDWVCEVHNDAPDDRFPAEYIRKLGDPRIVVSTHSVNLGGVGTFNLIFRATAEPFYTLLEDDNWWDPTFLETMVAALKRHPEADVAWCNQRVWAEGAAGQWRDTGRCVNPPEPGGPRWVEWGHPRQAMGAVHANGAMLIRSRAGADYPTPNCPFTSVEAFRERLFHYPLLYVPAPVAHFAMTRSTTRSGETDRWSVSLVLLAATFVRNSSQAPRQACAELWRHFSPQTPAPTNLLIWAGLIEPACRPLLHLATPRDWFRWFAGSIVRPRQSWRMLHGRRDHPDWWLFLDVATAARFREKAAAANGLPQP
jgi:hypothetical protein